uniref:Microtubule-associated serine/threonine-protein kinase pre-PK domain-containing protein n=1 Tax=Meloidogyne incognita TaxID=6306 RepID=A0A914MCH6_MELIC
MVLNFQILISVSKITLCDKIILIFLKGNGGGDQLSNNTPPIITSSTISSSPLFGCSTNTPPIDPQLLRLISDGATRFLHHQLCEIAADCLQKSRDDLLNCVYFCSMSVRLDETLAEAEMKVGPESYKYLFRLVKQMLMIVSRTARLLECLEFNPDEFYQLLGDAEVAVREQLGSGSARVPDLPQYILTKLGLNKNLSSLEKNIGEQTGDGAGEEDEEEFRQNKGQKDAQLTAQVKNWCITISQQVLIDFVIHEYILNNKKSVNYKNRKGWTALMYGAQAGNIQVCKLLLDNGANAELTNNVGKNANDLAVYWGHPPFN